MVNNPTKKKYPKNLTPLKRWGVYWQWLRAYWLRNWDWLVLAIAIVAIVGGALWCVWQIWIYPELIALWESVDNVCVESEKTKSVTLLLLRHNRATAHVSSALGTGTIAIVSIVIAIWRAVIADKNAQATAENY